MHYLTCIAHVLQLKERDFVTVEQEKIINEKASLFKISFNVDNISVKLIFPSSLGKIITIQET